MSQKREAEEQIEHEPPAKRQNVAPPQLKVYQNRILELYRAGFQHIDPVQKGVCCFWPTGSGKTFGALIASSIYPELTILVACPKSVMPGWEDAYRLFKRLFPNIRINDNLVVVTHQKLCNSHHTGKLDNDGIDLTNSFLILDEAHEFRTKAPKAGTRYYTHTQEKEIQTINTRMKKGLLPEDALKNYLTQNHLNGFRRKARAKKMLEVCRRVPKLALLTATPFVNENYDIANLWCMLHNDQEPLNVRNWTRMVRTGAAYRGLFHIVDNIQSDSFPTINESTVSVTMQGEYLRQYLDVEKSLSQYYVYNPHVFLTGLRQAAKKIDDSLSPGVDWTVQHVMNQVLDKERVLVYSQWLGNGIRAVKNKLLEIDPSFKKRIFEIDGTMSSAVRIRNIDGFNNLDLSLGGVCFVSDAGSCGVDFNTARATTAVCLGSSWNSAREEQAYSRIRRMGSLDHLSVEKRIVQVYRVIAVKPKDAEGMPMSGDQLVEDIRGRKKGEFNQFFALAKRLSVQ